MVLNSDWAQVEVIDLINDGSGLAFGIIGGKSTGVVVKTILPGGVADRDGRLQSGDHILQIGEVNLRGLGSEQVASVLRQCGVHVRMVVARPVESTSSGYQTLGGSHAPIVPTKILGDSEELDRHLIANGFAGAFHPATSSYAPSYICAAQPSSIQVHSISGIVDVVKDPLPIGTVPIPPITIPVTAVSMLPLDMALHGPALPETESFIVELHRDDLGLGITVAGYVCEKEEISGIFVKSISKGSAADLTNKIHINDRIVEVDGKSIVGLTNHQAVELLKNTGPTVAIHFERYLRGPKYEQLQQAIRANEFRSASPPSPTISSLPKIPLSLMRTTSVTIDPEGDSRTSLDFDSALLLDLPSPINEENEIVIGATDPDDLYSKDQKHFTEKWREVIDGSVEIIVAHLSKEPTSGLGISLEGTVDVEDGQEVRPHHYIRNILPDGPVGRSGILQSGDELLEVNGIRLMGLNHLEVVSILKQLPDFVTLVCARKPVPTRIIDISQCRDAFQARNILADSLQTLIPRSDKLVKAKSDTSLASSLEAGVSEVSNKSRSLELMAGLPMWSDKPTVVELSKGDRGLGFSVLDYQDPLNPQETVIVIRSLVPGGTAQMDGRLKAGDRLLYVNDINVERASLDRAVQVLKGAPKGPVKITVAKPISLSDTVSHTSQDTDAEDQTCLEEYQECIEEYQEGLEVVQICIDEESSFNHSSYGSQIEELDQNFKNSSINYINADFLENNLINNVNDINTNKNTTSESDHESFKSISDRNYKNGSDLKADDQCVFENKHNNNHRTVKKSVVQVFLKNDSSTHSDRPPSLDLTLSPRTDDVSERDGYETCVDESFSEDLCAKEDRRDEEACEDRTPTNSKINVAQGNFSELFTSSDVNDTNSEPCYNRTFLNQICLDTKPGDELKGYNTVSFGDDEFFLVQYIDDDISQIQPEVNKCTSEPCVRNTFELPKLPRRYQKRLKEYYNDYEDCLESYLLYSGNKNETEAAQEERLTEMSDEEIFREIVFPFRSRSSPNLLESPEVGLHFCDSNRRKSAFVQGYEANYGEVLSMTVLKQKASNCSEATQVENMLEKHWGSTRSVKVFREAHTSLGISIVGGKVDLHTSDSTESVLGIFIKNVVADSPAGKTGQFKTGDRILEVSGADLRQANHESAVDTIRNAANPVVFLVQSLIPWTEKGDDKDNKTPSPVSVKEEIQTVQIVDNKHIITIDKKLSSENKIEAAEKEQEVEKKEEPKTEESKIEEPKTNEPQQETKTDIILKQMVFVTPEAVKETAQAIPRQKTVESSEESDDDEEDVRELEGRTVSKQGKQIDRASAANLKRTKEEADLDPDEEDDYGYTTNKIRKKYANLGHSVMMVQLERSEQGLGLSLAGHKDRNCMAVFVCGLNPNGVAFRTGGIQVGDEILEVNGVVLHGRCHLNASAIIKGLAGPIFKVIILRRKTAVDDIAVKPITQFPVSLEEETLEDRYSNYPNVRTVSIKKGAQSLGIMIIEGKHAEVGQGIFISDIQEGSSAEKAGLEVGEMILAVNKDLLLGANYNTAASLLRRTEGIVTLVVSNPGKKSAPATQISATSASEPDKNSANKANLKVSGPPSRPVTPTPDPATCQITPGKDVVIEIQTENKGLGLFFVGGKDTLISNGIVVAEVYAGGAAEKDGRLQLGDQILDVNGISLKDSSNSGALQALRQTLPKIKLVVFRPDKIEYNTIEVDLIKKPGKGLGLSIITRKNGKGSYVSEILNGGSADVDGRIMKGDILISVSGQNVENSSAEETGTVLKTVTGRVALKFHRYKPITR